MPTIDEAIKEIQADIDNEDVEWDSPLGRAYKLSFEALKAVKDLRNAGLWPLTKILPGESK